jgi:hypothetical protein
VHSLGKPVEDRISCYVIRQNDGGRDENGDLRRELSTKTKDGKDKFDGRHGAPGSSKMGETLSHCAYRVRKSRHPPTAPTKRSDDSRGGTINKKRCLSLLAGSWESDRFDVVDNQQLGSTRSCDIASA